MHGVWRAGVRDVALRVQWIARYSKRKQAAGGALPGAEEMGRPPKRPANQSIFSVTMPLGAGVRECLPRRCAHLLAD